MYNNLTFLSNPVNGAQLLMQLTLWTFSVGSEEEKIYDRNTSIETLKLILKLGFEIEKK